MVERQPVDLIVVGSSPITLPNFRGQKTRRKVDIALRRT